MKKFFLFVILIIGLNNTTNIHLYAHHKTIKGKVMVTNGGFEPIAGATVRIANTVLRTITNKEGKFTIKNVPDGKFEIIISAVGMKTIKQPIELRHIEGDELELEFQMEESPVQTANIVVTATRSEKIYEDIPIKVSTIDEKTLNITNSNNIKEALYYQPGLRTEINCQNCGFSQVRINGMEGKYSQILIDGKPIFSTLNGVYGLDQIPTAMIDRIEVIRGGGSALYGGNAVAGVINIITKEPCENSYSVEYNNSFTNKKIPEYYVNLNTSIISEKQDVGLSLFGTLNQRNEFDANGDGFSEIGRMNVKTFGGKHFWKLTPKSKIVSEFHTIYHEIRGGNKFDAPPHEADVCETVRNNTILGQTSFEQYIGDNNRLSLYISFQETKRNSYYGANKDLNAYGITDNQTYAAGALYNIIFENILGYHIVSAGYDINYDAINDSAPAYNRSIHQITNTNGIFIQDDWNISSYLNLLWGARSDKHNLIDNLIINPRASLLWKIFEDFSLRATYSTGYRAPQAFDEDLHVTQVGGESLVIKLADGLKPEYSHSFNISTDYSLKLFNIPLALSLEYFNTILEDAFILEDYGNDISGNKILLRKNGDGAKVYGITAEIQSEFKDSFTFRTGVTYQNSLYDSPVEWSTGDTTIGTSSQFSDKIFRTPNLYSYFIASVKVSDYLNLDFSGNFTGRMYVPHYAGYINRDELLHSKSFIEINSKLSYEIHDYPDIILSIGCYNIFNSYQNDFDIGIKRDAGFIYGPARPITVFFSIKII
ncbi:MAG: TonB-dependent receptor [Bacteroidetes bacterium]|nr:TonB-dependent receptor [Bacteroidota bacterium]